MASRAPPAASCANPLTDEVRCTDLSKGKPAACGSRVSELDTQNLLSGMACMAAVLVALPDQGLRLCKLQRLPAEAPPTFVTLNPPQPPAQDKTIRQMQMAHPVFSYSAYNAQQKLHTVQVTHTGCRSCMLVSNELGKECIKGMCRQGVWHTAFECL